MTSNCVIFDCGPDGKRAGFYNPVHVIEAYRMDDLPAAFAAMQAAHDAGKWLAGVASYELGYAMTPKLHQKLPEGRKFPLLQFGVFNFPSAVAPIGEVRATLPRFKPLWDEARYTSAFQHVHDYIKAGDIYQANLTFQMIAHSNEKAADLYAAYVAKQPVPHGAFVDLGEIALLSRSPELFFRLSSRGVLQSRPMKGTAPRDARPDVDADFRDRLRGSAKDQAENLMIVDLLRNDMSRISKVGSVQVPELFEIESYATVHQMTSLIRSEVLDDIELHDIFAALFPCGSVTGAPKIRAMEILSDLEIGPRDAYCGGIGWIAPDGSMEMNVAIRTIMMQADGMMTLNVGGGVVYDSTATSEYAEALLKSKFAQPD